MIKKLINDIEVYLSIVNTVQRHKDVNGILFYNSNDSKFTCTYRLTMTVKPVTLTFDLLISNETGDQDLWCTIQLPS